MRVGFLFGGEVNPVRAPADEARVFIQGVGQDLWCAAFGSDDANFHVGIEEIFRASGGLESNLFSVGRPFWVGVRPWSADDLFHRAVAHGNNVQVSALG